MFLTFWDNRDNKECSEKSFKDNFNKDFVLLIFLLLFDIKTVIIEPKNVNWSHFWCEFVSEYRGDRFY